MRAVLDVNVIVSAVLTPDGASAHLLRAWVEGAYELVASPLLLDELERVLAYPKIRKRITADDAHAVIDLIRERADVRQDPATAPTVRSPDPGDDDLIALAEEARALIVSGDEHLLGLSGSIPVHSPAEFRTLIEGR